MDTMLCADFDASRNLGAPRARLMLLHDNKNQCQVKVKEETRMHLISPAVLPISILSTEKDTKQQEKQTKDRRQMIKLGSQSQRMTSYRIITDAFIGRAPRLAQS